MLSVRPENVKRLGRLQPGKIFLVDLVEGRIVEDEEVKHGISTQKPYSSWFREHVVQFNDLERLPAQAASELPLRQAQLAFGYTQEDLRVLHAPMARAGEEPIGSMGNDAALAVLSDQRPPLFNYFKQLFAQVTNPPIDSTRESIVMSLGTGVGAERNLLTETPQHAHQLVMEQPILRNAELETLRSVSTDVFRAHTIDITAGRQGPGGDEKRLANVCDEATDHIAAGINILVSPTAPRARRAPIPSLLAVSAAPPPRARGTRLRAGLAGVRRAARGPPLRRAHRLRDASTLPHARHRRRAPPAGHRRRRRSRRGRPGSSGAEQVCSRRSPRWGSRPSRATAARRSSRP
jgi:glutamate synthase (NADPH/NADH) large chain/glutamate synthase (ferredoxin)